MTVANAEAAIWGNRSGKPAGNCRLLSPAEVPEEAREMVGSHQGDVASCPACINKEGSGPVVDIVYG